MTGLDVIRTVINPNTANKHTRNYIMYLTRNSRMQIERYSKVYLPSVGDKPSWLGLISPESFWPRIASKSRSTVMEKAGLEL